MKTREISYIIHDKPLSHQSYIDGVSTIHKPLFGFTLVEILIVVTILGILAAIVFPEYQGHAQQTKESAAKENLRILRSTIERYAIEHNGVPPGYIDDDPTKTAGFASFVMQIARTKNYLPNIPENPFNNKKMILFIQNGGDFPSEPTGDYAWIYKPLTKQIYLDWPGTDRSGVRYYDY